MKQVVQNLKTGELTISDVPPPNCRSGGILVSVRSSLVSAGTERMIVNLAQASLVGKARQRPDQVKQVIQKVKQEGLVTTYQKVMNRLDSLTPLGYSCAGTVIAVGEGVNDIKVGDYVACAGAGYANHAEIVFVPRNLAALIHPKEDSDEAKIFEEAAFTTVGSIALQGIRIAEPTLGENIAVIGLGLIGQLTVQMLYANGCNVLGMDVNPERCKLALSFGCRDAVNSPEQFQEVVSHYTGGKGVDAVLITAGTKSNAPVELGAEICRERGRVVAVGLIGMDIPRKPFYDKELELRLSRSYGPGRYDPSYEEGGNDYPFGYVRWTENRNMEAFLRLLADGKLDIQTLITHRFSISEADKAYDLITTDAGSALGVILTYPGVGTVNETSVWLKKEAALKTEKAHLNLGIIGPGLFAQSTLLPALKEIDKAKIFGVCSESGISARHVGTKYGAAVCTSDAEELITNSGIDGLVIATRHDSHHSLIIKALKNGKHVFCEKPLALNYEQLNSIVNTYNNLNSPKPLLMIGFNRRFAPMTLKLKEFFAQVREPLGIHYRINAGYIPADHWVHDPKKGGGRIIGEGCHFVDFLVSVTEAKPVEVYAQLLANPGKYRNDNISALITFSDGSLATISYLANGDKAFSKERIEVFGGGSIAVLDDFRTLETSRDGNAKLEKSRLKQDKGHSAELKEFVQAALSGSDMPITFEEMVAVTKVTFAIEESIQSGRKISLE